MKRYRCLLLSVSVVVLFVGGCCLWVWQAKRQDALNQQLIVALVKGNSKAALSLVQQGADPNTRQEASPAPTLPQLLRQLLHRSLPAANDSPTALQLACGDVMAYWRRENFTAPMPPEDVPLVQAMLTYGADVGATDWEKQTALFYAVQMKHPHVAQLLLDSGVNSNASDNSGATPLMLAAWGDDVDNARRLLEHGASVTLTDMLGNTALHYALRGNTGSRIVRLLLAHGAAPHTCDKAGVTPLQLAQLQHRPDIVAMLQTGTK